MISTDQGSGGAATRWVWATAQQAGRRLARRTFERSQMARRTAIGEACQLILAHDKLVDIGGELVPGENRKRQKMVNIRLSDEEYEAVQGKADKMGMTVPAYLRELALRQKIRPPLIDKDGALEISKQVRAIGNNINQMAKKANEGKVQVLDLRLVKIELNEIRRLLSSLLGKGR